MRLGGMPARRTGGEGRQGLAHVPRGRKMARSSYGLVGEVKLPLSPMASTVASSTLDAQSNPAPSDMSSRSMAGSGLHLMA
jgi:hypothetical protein